MKQFLLRLIRIYFGIGAILAGLGFLALVWGIATQAECRDFGFVLAAIPFAVFSAGTRTLFWLPSLIHWWLAGPGPFLQWLLPSLPVTCGTS